MQEVLGITDVFDVADYAVRAGNHQAVGANNGEFAWDTFHFIGVVGVVKAFGCGDGTFRRVVRKEQTERNIGMALLDDAKGLCRLCIKGAIVSHYELPHAVVLIMPRDGFHQTRYDILIEFAVSE